MIHDSEVANLSVREEARQQHTLSLIPSENYASAEVRAALASPFTNKYAEGYPGARYYGGQEVMDELELLTQRRARKLFMLQETDWGTNVQPYSGSSANLAVFLALAKPGADIVGLSLSHGGHLTHGHSVSATGMLFKPHAYTLSAETQRLDMNAVRELVQRVRPAVLISGTSAYPREVDFAAFQSIAEEYNCIHLADIAHIAGLVASGVHQSPFPHADVVTMTTHKTLRGPRGAMVFSKTHHTSAIDRMVFPGLQGGPHGNTIAAKAVCLKEATTEEFKKYAEQIVANAKVLGETLLEKGFNLVTGGTDNHLVLLDLRSRGISGGEAEHALESAGIVANKNTIPHDPRPPRNPSGLRLGTPALTTRGMREEHMKQIANWILRVLDHHTDTDTIVSIRKEVEALAREYPAPSPPAVSQF